MKRAKKDDEGVYVPMMAFCYGCGSSIDLYYSKTPPPDICPKCGSDDIDTWGVEITKAAK